MVVLFSDLFVVLFSDLLTTSFCATYQRLFDVEFNDFCRRHLTASNTIYNDVRATYRRPYGDTNFALL